MGQAFINPKILTWSRNREGLSIDVIASKFNKPSELIESWEAGLEPLTFNQAKTWAQYTNTPFGMFFLREPPKESLPIPDRRTVNSHNNIISPELRDTLAETIRKQEWYKEYLKVNEIALNQYHGKFNVNDGVEKVVRNIYETLQVQIPPAKGTNDDFLRELIQAIESIGILVMRNGIVGNNTHRPLSAEDFRGFCIYDDLVPVIFINTNDAKSAQIFTLIHELAHLWISSSGISDLKPTNNKEEAFCNQLSGEYLVPSDMFTTEWYKLDSYWQDCIAPLTQKFKVSRWVIARKALSLNFISQDDYVSFIATINDKQNKTTSGGDYNKIQKNRTSHTLIKAVVSEALSGRLLLKDAQNLIGIRPSKIKEFAKKELNF